MRGDIARNHQPGMAAGAMVPVFLARAFEIVTHIHVISPFLGRRGAAVFRAGHPGILGVEEFFHATRAAMGTGDAHQCRFGCAPTPFSSISLPSAKRSSRYAAATSCGASRAMRCAKQKPDAGVALNPP